MRILFFALALAFCAGEQVVNTSSFGVPITRIGYVTHGINNFNQVQLVDWSDQTGTIAGVINEMCAQNPENGIGGECELITASTDRNKLVVTTTDLMTNLFGQGDRVAGLGNIPVGEVGTNVLSASNGSVLGGQRVIPTTGVPFGANNDINFRNRPTVGQFEEARGFLESECLADGTTFLDFTIYNANPGSLYTWWFVGADRSGEPAVQESILAGGATGLPNVMITDETGFARKQGYFQGCFEDACQPGNMCVTYITAYVHWDHQVYGATFDSQVFPDYYAPGGVSGCNHIFIPIQKTADLVAPPETDTTVGRSASSTLAVGFPLFVVGLLLNL